MKRVVLAVVFLALGAAALQLASPTNAYGLPCNDSTIDYYSDCTWTQMVGEEVHTCSGQNYGWGYHTSHFLWYKVCCGSGGPCCADGQGQVC
jgi:hypothetical protein